MLELAKQEVQSIQYAKIRNAAVSVKNEVLEMIAKVAQRKGRLAEPFGTGREDKAETVESGNTVLAK